MTDTAIIRDTVTDNAIFRDTDSAIIRDNVTDTAIIHDTVLRLLRSFVPNVTDTFDNSKDITIIGE